jgi:integrase
MPRLSDTKIRSAKPAEKPFKLYDSEGLYLIVTPNGSRWWRQRYRWERREQTLSLGTYPEVALADARTRGAALRKQIANGINPSTERQGQKLAQRTAAERSYKAILEEWLPKTAVARKWTADHLERVRRRFEVHFIPWLGRKEISSVTDDDILGCIRRMEERNLIDTAHRALSDNDGLFRYARQRKYIKHNVVADVRGPDTLPRTKVTHRAAITDPAQLGALLRAIDAYHGSFVVRQALRVLPLMLVRPGELQWAQWSEFDLDAGEWRIPAERMKMREYHIVPLAHQAVTILRELQPVTGPDGYVAPQVRNASRPISENTLNVALRAIGYDKTQVCAHGFRRTASTLLNEQGFKPDAIERQLAHGERNQVRGAYNAAQYLPERRKMMQAYADYLYTLKLKVAA